MIIKIEKVGYCKRCGSTDLKSYYSQITCCNCGHVTNKDSIGFKNAERYCELIEVKDKKTIYSY